MVGSVVGNAIGNTAAIDEQGVCVLLCWVSEVSYTAASLCLSAWEAKGIGICHMGYLVAPGPDCLLR